MKSQFTNIYCTFTAKGIWTAHSEARRKPGYYDWLVRQI